VVVVVVSRALRALRGHRDLRVHRDLRDLKAQLAPLALQVLSVLLAPPVLLALQLVLKLLKTRRTNTYLMSIQQIVRKAFQGQFRKPLTNRLNGHQFIF
jgi:hypothetical protein